MGLWLPLALSTIVCQISNALKSSGDKPTKLSSVLASWCLPTLSAAVKTEEDQQEANELIARFESLAARFGGVVTNG